jgi:hypothetical protein
VNFGVGAETAAELLKSVRVGITVEEIPLLEVNNATPLAFTLEVRGGRSIASVGEAADYFAGLSQDQREASHWKVAIRMLNNAIKEPSYLRTATMSLQTALLLDGILDSAHPSR